MDLTAMLSLTSTTILAFVAAVLIIVAVHEYGHYIVGRLSGIHAEVFSLGFGPVIWSRVDRHGTRWQLALLPLGGYVKFLGDSGAASKPDEAVMQGLSADERRHSMHGAPLWARASTVAAGPIFNFFLTIAIFVGLIWWQGVALDRPTVGTMLTIPHEGETLQAGDVVLALNGIETPDLGSYFDTASSLPTGTTAEWRVLRDGAEIAFQGPHPLPAVAAAVHPQSAALDAGLMPGDVIVRANGIEIQSFSDLPPIVEASSGAPIALVIWRAGETFETEIAPRRRDLPTADGFETRWLIGLSGGYLFEPATRAPGVLESLRLAVGQSWYLAKTNLAGLWSIVTGAISECNLSGPIGMASVMGDAARSGLVDFLQTIAMLSLGIGMLNLFPIPVLDGGHLVFHTYEALTGRPPSERALRILMTAGLALILSLMVFAITNDLFCP